MIKKQYDYYSTKVSYFTNFMDHLVYANVQSSRARNALRLELTKYKATLAKSKANYRYNIKWHDHEMYLLFVMRWA
jgi:hypothetical protein